MRIETMLKEEIENEFNELAKLEVGSDKYKATVDGLIKLVNQAHEFDKFEAELQEKIDARESETELKLKAAKDERFNRIVGHGINVLAVAVPAVITVWGTKVSLNFEKDGVVSTIMGKGFINRMLPKMR